MVTKDENSSDLKGFLGWAINHQETFQRFNILGHCLRHRVNTKDRMCLHKMAVEGVASIVQYEYKMATRHLMYVNLWHKKKKYKKELLLNWCNVSQTIVKYLNVLYYQLLEHILCFI